VTGMAAVAPARWASGLRAGRPGVVVGVDGTYRSIGALRWAANEARQRGVGLLAVHAMPANRRLSTLVRSGADVRDGLRALAGQLAAFHAAARHDQQTAAEGSRG
jgi:uncharacterized protein